MRAMEFWGKKSFEKELTVFALVAFGVPYLMGIGLWYCSQNGCDTSCFATTQMFYPAAGVMLAYLLGGRQGLPKRFYIVYLAAAAVCMVISILSAVVPLDLVWYTVVNVALILASTLGWIFLLTDSKSRCEAYGLRWHGKISTAVAICALFLITRTALVFWGQALSGEEAWREYLAYWHTAAPWINLLANIPLSFILCFLPFFGEEYGWRYYLTPVLQRHFGKRRGVLLNGVLWGLWHLPLNLFFYADTNSTLQSLATQIVFCVCIGVFLSYSYEKCGKNIWVPVLLHYLNNNMIVVWTGTADITDQSYTWSGVLGTAIIYGLLYLPFLMSKVFAAAPSTLDTQPVSDETPSDTSVP